jgi:hypothetical protein
MPSIKAIEARLPVAEVVRSAEFFATALGFEISTLWPQQAPEFAILKRDGLRLQLGKDESAGSGSNVSATLWLDVEELVALHAKIKEQTRIE